MPKTPSQKVRDMEARKRAAGLKEVRVWVPAGRADELRRVAEQMRQEQKEQET